MVACDRAAADGGLTQVHVVEANCNADWLAYGGARPSRPQGAAEQGDAMKSFALALPLMLLAACNNEPDIEMENASVSEVAQEMRKAGTNAFINHGKWKQTVSLLAIEAPGMPPEARQMMQKAMDRVQEHEVCLTPEQAKSPKEDFFAGADKNCRYDHFNWGDGKIDLKLNCKHPNATQTMVMVGSYEPNSYTMTMTATNVGSSPVEQMTMKMKVDAKRLGACDGSEKTAAAN